MSGGNDRPPVVGGLGRRPIIDVLGDVLVALSIEPPSNSTHTTERAAATQTAHRWLAGSVAQPAPVEAAARLVDGSIDEQLLNDLVHACALLNWSAFRMTFRPERTVAFVPPAFALLAPLFASRAWTGDFKAFAAGARPDWARRLLARAGPAVCDEALHSYRVARLSPVVRSSARIAAGVEPQRLAAACVVALTDAGVRQLLDQIVSKDRSEENNNV